MTAITKKPAPGKVGDNSLAAIAVQILALEKRSISNIVEIGRLLELAGEQCEHGEYGDWLKANFSWSSKTAYRYRGIYELSLEYSEKNCHVDNFGDLDISISALHLAAGFDTDDPKALAIFAAARKGRVSYLQAKTIVDEIEAADAADDNGDDTNDIDEPESIEPAAPSTPSPADQLDVPTFLRRDANNSAPAMEPERVKGAQGALVVPDLPASAKEISRIDQCLFTSGMTSPEIAGALINFLGEVKAGNVARLIEEKIRMRKLGEPKPAPDGNGGQDAIKAAADRAEPKAKLH